MNIPALKAFAPAVRRQLIEAVTLQLNHVLTARTPDYLDTYASQVRALRELAQADQAGLIERVAYTWFNRFTALRFLDARGWHPFGARVLTPATPDETQPELLKLVRSGHCPEELQRQTSLDRLNGLLDGRIPSNDAQGEVYRHLVLAACRFYNALLPDLFERLDDETELLLPDDLLTEHSVAQGFRSEIADEDCAEVEMLGWLYQFYISEKKDQVMARKAAVPTADIPAVTQLFTPHWIVRYLVENSLGRLWLLNRPDSLLRAWMPYYIEGEPETDFLHISRPEDIKVCDPAVGSGHMLTYAFDLLFVIYEEEGYAPSEIPALILRHNLHGLDICPRSAQLAEMALIFKAREKSSGFFLTGNITRPHILALQNVHFTENELRGYVEALRLGDLFNAMMLKLLHQFEEATTFGSLIQPCLDEQQIAFALGFIGQKDIGSHLFLHETHKKVLRVLEQAEKLSRRYHVVVANPPYMGAKGMTSGMKSFASEHFSDAKSNLFSMFMLRILRAVERGGKIGMMTPISWMSLASYADLRSIILTQSAIATFIQPEYNAFWDSAHVAICCFTLNAIPPSGIRGIYINLAGFFGADIQSTRALEAIRDPLCAYRYQVDCADFLQIPNSPIAYWLKGIAHFRGKRIGDDFISGGRNKTHNNVKYVRYVWEVNASGERWVDYANGGNFRKYAGNDLELVDWSQDARSFYESNGGLLNQRFWGKEGITWSLITSATSGFRLKSEGQIYSSGSPTLFKSDFRCDYIALGYLNSPVANYFLKAITPTVNTTVNDLFALPFRDFSPPSWLVENVKTCISLSRSEWDNYETSRAFLDNPMLRTECRGVNLRGSWENWSDRCAADIEAIGTLETQNNRLFIEIYGLQDELTPEVPEEQITIARADARKDLAAFLSYAVGCMMGRYSLDHPGLILANAGEGVLEYSAKVGLPHDQLTFAPDEDGIIPVLDGEWFEDDIVARTREFLRATFGEATLRDNIRFIEESLGRELRNYFLTDFYKDHLQTYKKRPIYWMIQSPRKGFSVLIYLHRYTRDTMNLVLNRYLREYQVKLRSRIAHLAEVQTSGAVSTRDKSAARKEFDKLTKTLHECEEWERQVVLPLAQARIELDLDDGVKVNYLKLGEALAPIQGLAAAED